MQSILRLIRVVFAVALCVVFLSAQRRAPGRSDTRAEEAREVAFAVVQAFERLTTDCGMSNVAKAIPSVIDVLFGPGKPPRGCDQEAELWRKMLLVNDFGIDGWRGPYLDDLIEDPWGSAFVITVVGFRDARQHVWVVSAGPNGRLETTARDGAPHGDDVALLARW